MRITAVARVLVGLLLTQQAYAVDGKSVTIISREKGCSWCSDDHVVPMAKPVLMTIRGNVVTRCDTLLNDGSFCMSPRFSLDGKRVALFRGIGGSNYISVIDLQTGTVSNITTLECWPTGSRISWPAGDWLYYINAESNGDVNWKSHNEIWRVNVVTRVAEYVYNYGPGGNPGTTYLKRWNCSADGKWATSMIEPTSYGLNITFHCFPPQESVVAADPTFFIQNWNTSGCRAKTGIRACNNSLSAGANFLTHYVGWHGELYIDGWDRTSGSTHGNVETYPGCYGNTICNPLICEWAGTTFDDNYDVGEWPLFCSNSEKWVCLQMRAAWGKNGSNKYLVNWIDRQAIIVSANPLNATNPSNNYAISNTPYYEAESGDFFVDGGGANQWQDTSGAWHAIDGTSTMPPRSSGVSQPASGTRQVGARIAVFSLRGSLVGYADGRGVSSLAARGAYVVKGEGAARFVSTTGR